MCGTCSFSRFGRSFFQVCRFGWGGGGYEVGSISKLKASHHLASADEVSGLWVGMSAAFCLILYSGT